MAYRKKLIEVSLPLEAINVASAHEKSIRHGHPSTLHLWWARRPLAACRAVLFAQLVDDPGSCPEEFPDTASIEEERARLHKIIADMVPWEASTDPRKLHPARLEIARSVARVLGRTLPADWVSVRHEREVIEFLQEFAPPVHDPFCGGGSIPLEAQRLGLRARGSDLNPVAVLISKALVEFPPKFAGHKPVNPGAEATGNWSGARGLADDVRFYGRWIRAEAAKRIAHLYPKVAVSVAAGDGLLPAEATVVAWLWARTVASPDPRAKGLHVPLSSTFIVSGKKGREVIVTPIVDRVAMTWRFEVNRKPTGAELANAKTGTKSARGANFICVLTGSAIDDTHVKAEAKAGRLGAALMAVVAENPEPRRRGPIGEPDEGGGRLYLSPSEAQESVATEVVRPDLPEVDQPMPKNPRWFSPPDYGMSNYIDLFSPRQLVALATFSDLVGEARSAVLEAAEACWVGSTATDNRPLANSGAGPAAYADAVATYLAFALSKLTDRGSTICTWFAERDSTRPTFARQAIPMTWDYAELNTLLGGSGSYVGAADWTAEAIENSIAVSPLAEVYNRDAPGNDFAKRTVFSTDPPYYDNIGYADLSDFFYVWLRRSMASIHPDLFRRVVTPKSDELVANPYRHGGHLGAEKFFLDGMRKAISGLAKASDGLPTTIYYAFKQTELNVDGITSPGWATFLQAVFDCGFMVDGTWPVRSELSNRMIASGTNALASSIVLVCRPRTDDAPSITTADFKRILRREMPASIADIRAGGVGPTDIQQAAIGPGIGIFTRHAAVLNPDGSSLSVKDALKLVNAVREEIASGDDADYDAPTRFALDWFAGHSFGEGASGAAITMAGALGLGLDDLIGSGVAVAGHGKTRVVAVADLKPGWDPVADKTPTAWEACHHLVRLLTAEDGGIDAAAQLHARLGTLAEPARALAERLYGLADGKGQAAAAYGYKSLYDDWPAIEARASDMAGIQPAGSERAQGTLL